jgi:ureidoglycolate hydrolase
MNSKPIQILTQSAFARFGTVLEFPAESTNRFEIIVREPDHPWRLAVFRDNKRFATKLENHPTSMETFEPFRGTTLLLVAEHDSPDDFSVFLLDKPICLHKGIWHDVVALSDEVLIRITENLEVYSEFHILSGEFEPMLAVE